MITGEHLNIGVYAYDMDSNVDRVYVQFLTDWTRVRPDRILISLVEDWLKKIVTKKQLEEMMKNCNSPYSSLQMTPPRVALDESHELIEWAVKTFLMQ